MLWWQAGSLITEVTFHYFDHSLSHLAATTGLLITYCSHHLNTTQLFILCPTNGNQLLLNVYNHYINIGETNCILLPAIILTEMFLLTVRNMCNVCLPWLQRNLRIKTHKRAFVHTEVEFWLIICRKDWFVLSGDIYEGETNVKLLMDMYILLSKLGKIVQWALQLKSDLAAAENYCLKGYNLKAIERAVIIMVNVNPGHVLGMPTPVM
jgi:hypothetical protein